MAECLREDCKVLQAAVEGLMARSGTALEFPQIRCIMRVRGADTILLSTVAQVTNAKLSRGDHALQAVAKDRDVVNRSHTRTSHPNNSTFVKRDCNLVVMGSMIVLVGVISRVLGESRMFGLIDASMHPVHCEEEDGNVIHIDVRVAFNPVFRPADLVPHKQM